jgi:triosephosphate isomerase
MRTPIIAGNWKMNLTAAEATAFANEIKAALDAIDGVDIAFCPPTIALPAVAAAVAGTKIGVGAQNMHFADSGAYTGECAANMLTPYCQYVIIGHSERRAYFNETDESVNLKIKQALAHELTPIVCVGESLEQREAGETVSFVSAQVRAAFAGLSNAEMARCVVAYEPIWAIGTGRSATPEIANTTIAESVRAPLAKMFGAATADAVRVQYGGSVKVENVAAYMAEPDIDGALVGGASLKPSFVELVRGAQP